MKLQWTQWRDIDDTEGLPKTRAYYRIRRKGEEQPFCIGICELTTVEYFFRMYLDLGYEVPAMYLNDEIRGVRRYRTEGVPMEYSISPVCQDYGQPLIEEMHSVAVLMHHAYRRHCGHSPEYAFSHHYMKAVAPLESKGVIGDPEWMGLNWESPVTVWDWKISYRKIRAFYILYRDGRPIYIGWSSKAYHGSGWSGICRHSDTISFSFYDHPREEADCLLTDMLAQYIIDHGSAPECHFRNHRNVLL